jgi:hypothetical protein
MEVDAVDRIDVAAAGGRKALHEVIDLEDHPSLAK